MTAVLPAAGLKATGGFDQYLQWGVDARREQAFWLCQQWVGRPLQGGITRDISLAILDRRTREISFLHDSEQAGGVSNRIWQQGGDWRRLQHNWPSGSFASEQDGAGRGRLFTSLGQGDWQLGEPADGSLANQLTWPLGGMRWQVGVRSGQMRCGGQSVTGDFRTASVQRWGRISMPGMAFIQSLQLDNERDDQFTAHGLMVAPALAIREPVTAAVGSLRWRGGVLDFDRWWPSPTLDAARLDRYRWMGTLAGPTHRLDIVADGDNPRVTPWLALNERQPDGHRRLLRVTPFARLHLRLFARGSQDLLQEWRTDTCLLMTAQPGETLRSGVVQAAP